MDADQRRKNDEHPESKGERRSFYVGESKEFYLSRRNADEASWKHLCAEDQTQFSNAIETEWQGVLDFKAVTIIDSKQAELSSINSTLQILASTTSEGTLADGEKAFMQGDPSVRDEPLYATPPPEGLPGVLREH